MYNWGIVRRVLGTLLFVFFNAVGVEAQVSECESFDDDRNGSIEMADAGPLIDEALAVTACMSTDFSAERVCEPYDANGDSSVSLDDYGALAAMRVRYTQCVSAVVLEQPECTQSDANGDGRVNLLDGIEIERFIDRYWSCLGADLSVLRCAWVDFDGDGTVSSLDQSISSGHWNVFESCLGTHLGSVESEGLWISEDRLMSLPTSGSAWERVFAEATTPYATPDLSDQDDDADTRTLAKALVGVRISREDLIGEARRALRAVTYGASENGANSLAVARGLVAYVFAADILNLAVRDPALDSDFRAKLRTLRDADLSGRTLISTHEDRPNNWGTHAGATRVAIALYLGDETDLSEAARVHRIWLGEEATGDRFHFGALSWQADEAHPVGINPRNASRDGIDIDGAQPEEMRRGGSLANPPRRTGYPWEALQGATVTTELLATHGYPNAWSWGDNALGRSVDYLRRLDLEHDGWWATGDDRWIVWLVNRGTGSDYPTQTGVSAGKNVGFTDWTHAE